MIDPAVFVRDARELGLRLFTGVPDSLLGPFCAQVTRDVPKGFHVVAANEGAAVGLAIGHYLRFGRPALVYMQNSGIGNAVNPLLSLADKEVYGIPMVLLVGWRGRAGVEDEPQHVKQGRVMQPLLDALEIPWSVLPSASNHDATLCLERAVATARERTSPYVILVEKKSFSEATEEARSEERPDERPSREESLKRLVEVLGDDAVLVSTTGMLSRELFEHRAREGRDGASDFLTVGGMGHSSSIALGVAMGEREREVWCLDGDGALLMHMGSLPVIAAHAPGTFFHVVFNNGVHDSVGGQPTCVSAMSVPDAARAAGYRFAATATAPEEIAGWVEAMRRRGGPALLELIVRPGSRPGIGRPTRTPRQSKGEFMSALNPSRR